MNHAKHFNRLLDIIADNGISISFSADGSKVRFVGPENAITPEFVALLGRYKRSLWQFYGPDRLPARPDEATPIRGPDMGSLPRKLKAKSRNVR